MYRIILRESNHTWAKSNLVTITTGKKPYDAMHCEKCGIKGRRYNLAEIMIDGRYNEDKVMSCPFAKASNKPKRVKVTHCAAVGSQFENLVDGSEHDVIAPPIGYKNDHKGVWVMGVGEPVKLLNNEYTPI